MSLRATLIAIGLFVGVPVIPDGGFQLALATVIGLLLPMKIVKPMNTFVLVVAPPAIWLERKLENVPRLKHLIPRIVAGYLITIIIGAVLVLVGYALPG